MTQMTPFRYVEFYDVPRCIVLRYRKKLFLLQSAFDDDLDEYADSYSVHVLPGWVEDLVRRGSWEFLGNTRMSCIGDIRVKEVVLDPTKRKELNASILDSLVND